MSLCKKTTSFKSYKYSLLSNLDLNLKIFFLRLKIKPFHIVPKCPWLLYKFLNIKFFFIALSVLFVLFCFCFQNFLFCFIHFVYVFFNLKNFR